MNRPSTGVIFLCWLAVVRTATAAGFYSQHPMGPERVADCAGILEQQTGGKRPATNWFTRTMAVSIAYKMIDRDGDGRFELFKADMAGRVAGYAANAERLAAVVKETPMPEAHRDVLIKHFARTIVYPIRYRTADPPMATWTAMIKAIPPESVLLKVAPGKSLNDALTEHWSGWAKTPAVARKVVMDRLAQINPRLRIGRAFRTQKGRAQDGFVAGNGLDVTVWGGWKQLIELVPELDITPMKEQQFEQVVLPIDGSDVWVVQYRLNPSGILVPAANVLAEWAAPEELVLRNLPLGDLSCLGGLHPKKLDISGTDISDLSDLARLTDLEDLDVSSCPVTDISPLSKLRKLRRLELWGTKVTDLSPIATLPIEYLDIDFAPVKDLAPLSKLPLKMLFLAEDAPYENLDAVAALEKIGDIPFEQWKKAWEWKQEVGPYWEEKGGGGPVAACGDGGAKKQVKKPAPPQAPPPVVKPKKKAFVPKLDADLDLDL